jgi:hypothetical protein
LETEQMLLPSDDCRVKVAGEEHAIQVAGFPEEPQEKKYRVEMAQKIDDFIERIPRLPDDQPMNDRHLDEVRPSKPLPV